MVEVYSGGPVRVEKRFPHLTDWIQTVIMSGRRLLVKDWKAPNAPALSLWASSLGQLAAYERLSYRLFNKSGRVRIKVGILRDVYVWPGVVEGLALGGPWSSCDTNYY